MLETFLFVAAMGLVVIGSSLGSQAFEPEQRRVRKLRREHKLPLPDDVQ